MYGIEGAESQNFWGGIAKRNAILIPPPPKKVSKSAIFFCIPIMKFYGLLQHAGKCHGGVCHSGKRSLAVEFSQNYEVSAAQRLYLSSSIKALVKCHLPYKLQLFSVPLVSGLAACF